MQTTLCNELVYYSEEINAETNGDFTIEPIDLNSLDLIQANKEDTVRVPIRQLRVSLL